MPKQLTVETDIHPTRCTAQDDPGNGARTGDSQYPDVVTCGVLPEGYDAKVPSEDGRCPHCGEEELVRGYGLAAGGVGPYSYCEACGRFCDAHEEAE